MVKNCSLPPNGKLIEILVRETEKKLELVKDGSLKKIPYNYVMDWQPGDPSKLRKTNLVIDEEFLNFLSSPIKPSYNIEDLEYCLGMYVVSSPQFTDFEPGGINAVVIRDDNKIKVQESWTTFKRIMGIIPSDFKKTSSRNFYSHLETSEQPNPVNSLEVNLSYLNNREIPIHIPLPFNLEFKDFVSYKDHIKEYGPVARTYMLDALLYQPEIPIKYQKRVEEAMYFVLDYVLSNEAIPCCMDIGSVISKLATSFARLKLDSEVTLNDLDKGKNLWASVMSRNNPSSYGNDWNIDKMYGIKTDENVLRSEIIELNSIGLKVTFELLKQKTKLFEFNFKTSFDKLRACGYIYIKPDKTIGVIEY